MAQVQAGQKCRLEANAEAEALANGRINNLAFGCFERHDRERSNVAVAATLPVVCLHAISYDLHQLSHDEQLSPTIVHSIVARPESDCCN